MVCLHNRIHIYKYFYTLCPTIPVILCDLWACQWHFPAGSTAKYSICLNVHVYANLLDSFLLKHLTNMWFSLIIQTHDSHPYKITGKLSAEEICALLGCYGAWIHALSVNRCEEELILCTHLKWAVGKVLYNVRVYPSLCFQTSDEFNRLQNLIPKSQCQLRAPRAAAAVALINPVLRRNVLRILYDYHN